MNIILAGALLLTGVALGVAPRLWGIANAHDELPVVLPDFQPLSQRSTVYDVAGNVIAVFERENQQPITLDKVPDAVVAALLAVVGYSINDTIIVFDRIRERFEANRRLPPALALDQSINQTLSRTIMTKVTTLIVVVALLVLGGSALGGFSEALVIGIVAGTYSSIYISASVALDLGLKAEHVFPVVRGKEVDSLP